MRNAVIVMVLLVMTFACSKDDQPEYVETSKNKTLAENLTLDAFRQVLAEVPYFYKNGVSSQNNVEISSDVAVGNNTYPKTITINYGESNLPDDYGVNHRGKINVEVASAAWLSGDFSVTYEYFYVNDSRLLGALDASYKGVNGFDGYQLVLRDSSKVDNANGAMSWNGTLDLIQLDSLSTSSIWDDIYSYAEVSSGQDFQGRSFTSKSLGDCRLDFSCRWLVDSGSVEVSPNGKEPRTLNFRADSCTNVVDVEVKDGSSSSFAIY